MTLLERFHTAPRVVRWATLAITATLAYFLLIEPALDAASSYNARADVMQAGLDRQSADGPSDSGSNDSALSTLQFGSPLSPGGPERSAALNARVESLLRDRRVSDLSIRARTPVALPRASFAAVLPDNRVAQRLILDIQFEASPADAVAFLADLERAPEVSAISRATFRTVQRDGVTLVQLAVSPESWIFSPKNASASAPSAAPSGGTP